MVVIVFYGKPYFCIDYVLLQPVFVQPIKCYVLWHAVSKYVDWKDEKVGDLSLTLTKLFKILKPNIENMNHDLVTKEQIVWTTYCNTWLV